MGDGVLDNNGFAALCFYCKLPQKQHYTTAARSPVCWHVHIQANNADYFITLQSGGGRQCGSIVD